MARRARGTATRHPTSGQVLSQVAALAGFEKELSRIPSYARTYRRLSNAEAPVDVTSARRLYRALAEIVVTRSQRAERSLPASDPESSIDLVAAAVEANAGLWDVGAAGLRDVCARTRNSILDTKARALFVVHAAIRIAAWRVLVRSDVPLPTRLPSTPEDRGAELRHLVAPHGPVSRFVEQYGSQHSPSISSRRFLDYVRGHALPSPHHIAELARMVHRAQRRSPRSAEPSGAPSDVHERLYAHYVLCRLVETVERAAETDAVRVTLRELGRGVLVLAAGAEAFLREAELAAMTDADTVQFETNLWKLLLFGTSHLALFTLFAANRHAGRDWHTEGANWDDAWTSLERVGFVIEHATMDRSSDTPPLQQTIALISMGLSILSARNYRLARAASLIEPSPELDLVVATLALTRTGSSGSDEHDAFAREALDTVDRALERGLSEPSAAEHAAKVRIAALARLGRADEALALLEQTASRCMGGLEDWAGIGELYLSGGSPDRAAEAFERARSRGRSATLALRLAAAYDALGKLPEARERRREAALLLPPLDLRKARSRM